MKSPVFINQTESEFKFLLRIFKKKNPRNILEIGSQFGGTLYQWITNSKDGATILSIDEHQVNSDLYQSWTKNKVKVLDFKGDSHSDEALAFSWLCSPYDWIFLDGDHSYEGSKQDWELALKLSKPGTIIVIHDIADNNLDTPKLWKEIKNSHYFTEEIIEYGATLNGIGVVYL
jgi:predicted O-methyltransferase YrrM